MDKKIPSPKTWNFLCLQLVFVKIEITQNSPTNWNLVNWIRSKIPQIDDVEF
jgi:hypothetical protein